MGTYNVLARGKRFKIECDNITRAEEYCIELLNLNNNETIEVSADVPRAITHTVKRVDGAKHWNHPNYKFNIRP